MSSLSSAFYATSALGFTQKITLKFFQLGVLFFLKFELINLIYPHSDIPISLSICHMLSAISFLSVSAMELHSLIPLQVRKLKVSRRSCKTPVTHF